MLFDDEVVLDVRPGDGGFWEYGEYDKRFPAENNPWRYSNNKMAPFDTPVSGMCKIKHHQFELKFTDLFRKVHLVHNYLLSIRNLMTVEVSW